MEKIKTIIFALGVSLLFINADCNKVEETPSPVTYQIEGRLVNSCTDNTPLKNRTFLLRDENDKLNDYSITAKTDSNGYFKIKSEMKGRNLIIEDGFGTGKTILYKIPGGQSINFGEIAYNFNMALKLVYKNFIAITLNDSIFISVGGVNPSNPYSRSYIRGPLSNENLGTIYIKETPMYSNPNLIKGEVYLNKNNFLENNLIGKKQYLVAGNCNTTEEIIFE